MRILLISTYELGRQPFGIASPAAMLHEAGHEVACLDLSVQRLDPAAVERAALIAFYLPMHTATRIALAALDRVAEVNPTAHLCAYGLYAPVSGTVLRERGVQTILGGEFEPGLVNLATRVATDASGARRAADAQHTHAARHPDATTRRYGAPLHAPARQPEPEVSWERQQFVVPRRTGLPPLEEYARLVTADGSQRTVGYTEASRGCKHLCRHCPVVPVYGGRFRIVQADVVLADIEQQVAMGARHITFGDPDFFNGPRHAVDIVRALHTRHPALTYDVTIKIEHLLRHEDLLRLLHESGCAFVTSAVESVDDAILEKLDKGHTAADFERVVGRCRDIGLALQPTFVAFTPWVTLEGYEEMLATIARLDLVDNVPSIQLAIRLLIPAGSRLLELDEVQGLVGAFDPGMLGYRWNHRDPRVDALQCDLQALVQSAAAVTGRREVFLLVWEKLQAALQRADPALPPRSLIPPPGRPRATIPYLSEPWYC